MVSYLHLRWFSMRLAKESVPFMAQEQSSFRSTSYQRDFHIPVFCCFFSVLFFTGIEWFFH
jgi:hypothetical protein